ncbi:Putative ribonuclease H protein [Arachis hypogaea]|nr:Putative ribonuclease H protein [Arachis hypogaea]
MKIDWDLVEKKDVFWSKVLRAKYRCDNDIIPTIERRNNGSNLWKGICSSWKDVQANTIWRLGDGAKVNFWKDKWVLNLGSLNQYTHQVSKISEAGLSLTDFLTVLGGWDMAKLQEWPPKEVTQKIVALSPPSSWKQSDQIAWALHSDGLFSLKTAYQYLQADPGMQSKSFNLIWHWRGLNVLGHSCGS